VSEGYSTDLLVSAIGRSGGPAIIRATEREVAVTFIGGITAKTWRRRVYPVQGRRGWRMGA
jgi:hypothetical protein